MLLAHSFSFSVPFLLLSFLSFLFSPRAVCDALRNFDAVWVDFEYEYVSTFVHADTQVEYDDKQTVCVLFSETLLHVSRSQMILGEGASASEVFSQSLVPLCQQIYFYICDVL